MIYLAQIERSSHHSMNIMPLGPLQVGSALHNAGYPIKIIHIEEKDIDATVSEIARTKPLWVGLSVITGPQTVDSAIFSEKLKKLEPNIPIVWGGIHPSLATEQCISEDYIDYVVIGEGEDTAIELTQKLEARKKGMSDALGLAWKANGKIIINPKRPFIKNLDDDKYRLNFELVNLTDGAGLAREAGCSRIACYKTSRGCPWACAFCYSQNFHNRRYRAKSAEKVIEDIQYLKEKYKIDGVRFYDDNFYARRERAQKIIESIGIPAKTDIRIDQVDEELAQWMKQHQVFDVLIGIESGSNRILKLMNKGFDVDTIKQGVEILAKYDIKVSYSAIIGLPTETREEINATIDLLLWIHERHKNMSVTVGPYLPYPGTPLYQFAMEHGFVSPSTTKEWGLMDRWDKSTRLPWCIDEYIYWIREYLKFFDYQVPLLSKITEMRLKRRFVSFPADVAVVNWIYHHAIEGKTLLARTVRGVHKMLRYKRRKRTQ